MKEPEFILDEKWLEQEKVLKEILDEVKDPELEKNTFVLQTFVRGAAYAFVDKKKLLIRNRLFPMLKEEVQKEVIPAQLGGEELMEPKYYNEVVNIQTGVDVYPVPVPSYEGNIQPVLEFKEVPIYTKKLIRKPEDIKKRKKPFPLKRPEEIKVQEKLNNVITKDLVVDRITNKVLATASISDKYIINEPGLDSADIDVLMKIKKKKLKNMERGWKLIQKYGKKYGIKEGHDTLIKYYIVNDFFGLGRIEPLVLDKDIKTIICDGENKNIKVEINDKTFETNMAFLGKDELFNFVYGVADRIGLKLNWKNKTVNGVLRGFEFTLNIGEDLQSPSFKIVRK